MGSRQMRASVYTKLGFNLGPTTDKPGPKPCTVTQNKARRVNKIAFLSLSWAQEVSSSNLGAPTTQFFIFDSPATHTSGPGTDLAVNFGPDRRLSTRFAARCSRTGIACKLISRGRRRQRGDTNSLFSEQ